MGSALLAAAASLSSPACGARMTGDSGTVEIFSWWTAPGEVDALDALIANHRTRRPGTTIVNAAATDSMTARTRLSTRLQQGMPPDIFQTNVGSSLFSYVRVNGMTDADSLLEPVDSVLGTQRTLFPQRVLDSVSVNGRAYGIPVNIHRINVLYYNTSVLQAASVRPPTTLAEIDSVCTAVEASGKPCFAMPARDGWTITLVLFESIVVAQAGADFYEQFMTGRADPRDPRMQQSVDLYLRLLTTHSAPDSHTLSWDQAVARVGDGQAAFTVMGDWAKGFLAGRGRRVGVDFGSVPFPGTTGNFVFTSDAFVLPRGAANRAGALEWLTTCASSEGQLAFNLLKGSVPARSDVSPAMFDAIGQQTLTDLGSNRLLLATSGLTGPRWTDAVSPAAVEMVARRNSMGFINTMVANYNTLQQ